MSVAPSRNPLPKWKWQFIKKLLAEHGVAVDETRQHVIVDDVGDEYATFALLYVKDGDTKPEKA